MSITIVEVVEKRMKLLCEQQDFEAASNVREIKYALMKCTSNVLLTTKKDVRVVNDFLDIVADKK
jgi:hypothetical protein